MSEGKWCYSYNGENYEGDFDTREAAIEEALYYMKENHYMNQEYIDVGQTKAVEVGIDAWLILEQISEDVYEKMGEYGDDYLTDVKLEHQNILEVKLNEVLESWLKEFKYEPKFYAVENVEQVKVNK